MGLSQGKNIALDSPIFVVGNRKETTFYQLIIAKI